MARSVRWYEALGFEVAFGGSDAPFTTCTVGDGFLNLQVVDTPPGTDWGRAIFYVDDVDAVYEQAVAAGLAVQFEPSDAPWGERYFHLRDPDGHEISIAKPLVG